jgi:two-component system NtrC family sensor kinase
MTWLAFGVLYAVIYGILGALLQGSPLAVHWIRLPVLLVPPLFGIHTIVRRRQAWTGCQWLFWATIALGLMMSATGLVGWTVDEILLQRQTSWLGWHTVFALFGAAAPLLALLAQPHRGSREDAAASTAVDIAGIAVVIGFLYSYFVTADGTSSISATPSFSLVALSELQQFLIAAGLTVAAVSARRSTWGPTYRRLAMGLWVQFAALTLSNAGISQGGYRALFVYDFVWIVPFAFYPWAAQNAPASSEETADEDAAPFTPSRPWLIFGALALVPLVDSVLRKALPLASTDDVRGVSMAVTLASTLPILMARLAVERAQTRHADSRLRLLAAAIEQADELIWIVARDGRFEHTNSALRQAVGYTEAEFDGLTLTDLVADQSREQAQGVEDAVHAGQGWRGTIMRRRKDGTTFPSSATVVPLSDDRGRIAAVLGVERDMTEDLRLRQQLIHTERLSAVGQLVSGVAHELNNPLQSILGFSELLIESEQRRSTRRDLERVRDEAERAGKIVGNLLAFVRRTSVERIEADFNDLVSGAVAIRAYELKTRNIDIEEHYAAGLGSVVANREEVRQIIINLILNAEHAMQRARGGGRLVVRTGATGSGVFAEIADDGPGVPSDLAGQIFEPFFTTKAVGEGTGLGLSISVGIAEAHGGSLALVPSHAGACFRLTLPATGRGAGADETVTAIARAATDPGRRALVVDDEAAVRELLKRLLKKRGFAIDVASDGRAASALIEARAYDLILCDIRMPRMGGLMLYERIRDEHPNLLRGFVFITGDTVNAEIPDLVEPTHAPLLSKPFTTADLDALLRQLGSLSSCPS